MSVLRVRNRRDEIRREVLDHHLACGGQENFDPNVLFDAEFYVMHHPEAAETGRNPLVHFLEIGAHAGFDPHPSFSTAFYLEQCPGDSAARANPIRHYIEIGTARGLDPHPDFDTDWYLESHPDVARSGLNPLVHYIRFGRAEGRWPRDRIVAPTRRQDRFEAWLSVNGWNRRVEESLRTRLAVATSLPRISVVISIEERPIALLRRTVASLTHQIYEDWELCIAAAKTRGPAIHALLQEIAANPRIRVVRRECDGLGVALNDAAALAKGDYLVLLGQDDELSPDALAEIALGMANTPDVDIAYVDSDKIDEDGRRFDAAFKPDWSPELLLSYMYCGLPLAVRRSLFVELGGLRPGFEGSEDHDLALRAGERARRVLHVPKILCHRRPSLHTSVAAKGGFEGGRRAVQEALERRGSAGVVHKPAWATDCVDSPLEIDFRDDGPSVTIIIPTKNRADLLRGCILSLRSTTYLNYRVLIVDNESDDPETLQYLAALDHEVIRVVDRPGGFNFAYLCNHAIQYADSDFVLFLNNDTEVIEARWLSRMVGTALLPGVGVVGALLLYPDDRVQHAGVVHGFQDGVAGHAFKRLPADTCGYLLYDRVTRNCSAVTAACMLTGRHLFLAAGGFDENAFAVGLNDVDYCHRIVDRGLRVVFCAGAKLRHHEGATRGFRVNPAEVAEYRRRYEDRRDPFYNPNLSLESELFEIQPRHVAIGRKRPLRVVLCTHSLKLEGAPKTAFTAAAFLKRSGHLDPLVISPQDGPMRKEYEALGIDVVVRPTPISPIGGPVRLGLQLRDYEPALDEFCEWLRSTGGDVVWANTMLAFWGVDAAKRIGLPSVWMIRESEGWQRYYDFVSRDVARRAVDCFGYPYRVVFVSHATRHLYESLNERHNFTVVHNGIDLEQIQQAKRRLSRSEARASLGVANDEVVVASIGTLCERKRQKDLIEAFEGLPSKEIRRLRLFIVGDQSEVYGHEIISTVARLPSHLRAKITLVKAVEDPSPYYRAADFLVLSSAIESHPRVVLEAMAYELPIIATPVFGVVEQVADGLNALLYPTGDVAALRAAMLALATDPVKRERFSAMALPMLCSNRSFAAMCREYCELLGEAYFTGEPSSAPPMMT